MQEAPALHFYSRAEARFLHTERKRIDYLDLPEAPIIKSETWFISIVL